MFQLAPAPILTVLTEPFRLAVLVALAVTTLSGLLIIILARVRKVAEQVTPPRLATLRKVVYSVTAVAIAVSGLTGLSEGMISGWALWWHMAVAPLIISGILMVGLLGAERASLRSHAYCARNIMFWLTLSLSVVAIGSILLCMLPVFGSDDQATLYKLHKYSALFLLCAFVLHLCGCIPGKPEKESGIGKPDSESPHSESKPAERLSSNDYEISGS